MPDTAWSAGNALIQLEGRSPTSSRRDSLNTFPMLLLPNPLQRLTELPLNQGACQFALPKDAVDPPDLKSAKAKVQPDPVGGLSTSGSPFFTLLPLGPDPLQDLSVQSGGGGPIRKVPPQGMPNLQKRRARARAKVGQVNPSGSPSKGHPLRFWLPRGLGARCHR